MLGSGQPGSQESHATPASLFGDNALTKKSRKLGVLASLTKISKYTKYTGGKVFVKTKKQKQKFLLYRFL